jgi:hypothetical protein
VRNRSRLAWRSSSQLLLLPCGCCWLLVLLPPLAVGSRQQLPSMHGASGGMAAPPPSAVQHEVCDPICSACFRAATRPGRGWLHHWSAGGVAWPLSAQLTIPRSIGDAPVNASMRRSSEYLEEGYGVSYRVQNLTVSKIGYQHFFRTELHLRIFDESLAELSEPDTTSTSIGNTCTCTRSIQPHRPVRTTMSDDPARILCVYTTPLHTRGVGYV